MRIEGQDRILGILPISPKVEILSGVRLPKKVEVVYGHGKSRHVTDYAFLRVVDNETLELVDQDGRSVTFVGEAINNVRISIPWLPGLRFYYSFRP